MALPRRGLVNPLFGALALLAMALVPSLKAQEVDFKAQVRPRFEARTPVDGDWDYFTSMRTRVALLASLDRNVSLFAQVQDVRLWGSENNTLTDFSADGFDLHQGYVTLGFQGRVDGYFRAGRQEINYGGQRLVGAVDWAQQARSFDGAVLNLVSNGGHKVDLLASKISENTAQNRDVDADFLSLYGTLNLDRAGNLDLYWMFNRDSRDDAEQTEEHTYGARWVLKFIGTELRAEGSMQSGTRTGEDSDAYMFGLRWGGALGDSGFGGNLWYDYLSGDQSLEDGKAGTFNTLYATNHKFYGFYDLFLDIPTHTGRHGLQDYALKTFYRPGGAWDFMGDLHYFQSAQQRELPTSDLATELDLTVRYRYSAQASLMGGYAYVWAADGLTELGRITGNGQWAYLQLNVAF